MKLVSRLMSKSLMKRNPLLDLGGADRRVLNIACQDLMNYLKVQWGLTEQEAPELKLRKKISIYFYEKPQELEEFIHLWSGLWNKKWNERVKIVLGKNFQRCKRDDELLRKAEPVWRKLKQRNKIKDMVVEALVKNGEICGTSILANNLLKIEIGMFMKGKTKVEDCDCTLNIVNNVLRKTRKISQSKGPLIFFRIGKSFFRLLRDDVK